VRAQLVAAIFLAGLAASARAEPPQPAPLSVDGMGWLQVGMSEADLLRHFDPAPSSEKRGKWWRQCHLWRSQSWPGLSVMVEDGQLARLSFWQAKGAGAEQSLAVKTEAGIGLGASAAELSAAYGEMHRDLARQNESDHSSVDVYYLPRGLAGRGLRFTLDPSARVTAIYAGGPQIGYGEDCQ
jgi:hypothetical protein